MTFRMKLFTISLIIILFDTIIASKHHHHQKVNYSSSKFPSKKQVADHVTSFQSLFPISPTQPLDTDVETILKSSTVIYPTVSRSIAWESYDSKFKSEVKNRRNDRDKNKLFYIHDLGAYDDQYWWAWPAMNTSCEGNPYLNNSHATLAGIGEPLDLDVGLFGTWHFSLFNSLYNRLRRSPRRTMDPEKASFFIIPYDLALDGYLDRRNCQNRLRCMRYLMNHINIYFGKNKYFKRYDGADHVVLWSLHQYHTLPGNGCNEFIDIMCKLCTFTCYWSNYTIIDNRYVSVPFPSSYHWWDGIKNPPWSLNNVNKRNITAVYLGSMVTITYLNTKIRKAVALQCDKEPDCHWLKVAHRTTDMGVKSSISSYERSIFCLNPPGDDSARRAVFDSLVAGCIPVIFDYATLYNQYHWHMNEQIALDISIYIPGQQVVNNKISIMKVLKSIHPDIIRKKQAAIAILAPTLQYSIPPLNKLANLSDETIWEPPFQDGIDRIVDGIFARVHDVLHKESTGIPNTYRTKEEWSNQYAITRIEVPRIGINQKNRISNSNDFNSKINFHPPNVTYEQRYPSEMTFNLDESIANKYDVYRFIQSMFGKGNLPSYKVPLKRNSMESYLNTTSDPIRNFRKEYSIVNSKSWESYDSKFKSEVKNRRNDRDKNKLFYIHDLGAYDDQYWWAWPAMNTSCEGNPYLNNSHATLAGIGEPLDLDVGLFGTWHFSLFNSLYNRLRRSPRRTMDPEKASFFIIPYDLALDGYLDRRNCQNRLRCMRYLVNHLYYFLGQSKYFKRYDGADHVVLWSLHQYHKLPGNQCNEFIDRLCKLCTFTCYWSNYTIIDNRYVSVPFPSSYHWWDGIKNPPWSLNNVNKRNITAVYLGSMVTITYLNTKIRKAVALQCDKEPDCHWLKVAHRTTDMGVKSSISSYERSIFCLNPPGDDSARRAVFDSLVAGCIPVIFDYATLYNQYHWHMNEQIALDISIYIPGQQVVNNKISIMKVLKSIHPDIIRKKQAAIAILAPTLQYSIPPLNKLANLSDETIWEPPFQDGIDRIVDGIFARVHDVLHKESTGIPNTYRTKEEWSNQYAITRIEVPHIEL